MISSEITLLINLKNTFIFPSAIPLRNPSSFWDFFWHCFRKIVKYNIFQTIHLRISSVLTLKFSLKNVYVLADILAATHFFLEIDLDISFKNSVFFFLNPVTILTRIPLIICFAKRNPKNCRFYFKRFAKAITREITEGVSWKMSLKASSKCFEEKS